MADENQADLKDPRNSVLHYILNYSCSKFAIKNSDIISDVLNGNAALFHQVLPLVKAALENVYGMRLLPVPDSRSGKQFIVVSQFVAISSKEFDQAQRSQITLLFVVLSYIYMKEAQVSEECLEEFLSGLRIYFDRPHPYFGPNIKKLITETFVRQLYLKKVKSDSDAVKKTPFYEWGFRSEVEFHRKDVLQVVAKLLNKPTRHFVAQYIKANANEAAS